MTRYSSGQGILARGSPLTKVVTLNNVLDVADAYALQRLSEAGGNKNTALPLDLVRVKNTTGSALRFGEVVELNGSALGVLYYRFPWFNAAVPNESRPFAVMLEPLPSDSTGTGLAQISGIAPALANITNTGDLWGFVSAGSRVLQSHPFWGDVRIVAHQGIVGEQACWVIFEKYLGELLVKNDSAGDIDAGAFGTFMVYTGAQGGPLSTGRTVGAFNRASVKFKNGKWGAAAMLSRRAYAVPYQL